MVLSEHIYMENRPYIYPNLLKKRPESFQIGRRVYKLLESHSPYIYGIYIYGQILAQKPYIYMAFIYIYMVHIYMEKIIYI